MRKIGFVLFALGSDNRFSGLQQLLQSSGAAACTTQRPWRPQAPRIYVTNEVGGDLTIIDSGNYNVLATVPLGKRPRGIHPSPDDKTIYVALSGSPIAGPDVDESTLPPPDKTADGIGVFDVAQKKVLRIIHGGSDPENFDVSQDGTQLYISNEDAVSRQHRRHCFRHRGQVSRYGRTA